MNPTERLAKIAALIERADEQANGKLTYLDAGQILGVYLLAISAPGKFKLGQRVGASPGEGRP